jgi:hypothetical protein
VIFCGIFRLSQSIAKYAEKVPTSADPNTTTLELWRPAHDSRDHLKEVTMARLLARGHRRSCPAFELALFAFLLAVRWPEVTVSGAPYMVLVTGAAKCFTVDAPRQTALEVRYHAPGKTGERLAGATPCSLALLSRARRSSIILRIL